MSTSTSTRMPAPATSPTRDGPPAEGRSGWKGAAVLAGFVGLSQAAGMVGIPFTERAVGGWYDQLDKPSFNPPSWVFAPVWTTLYLLMGVAAWLVWRHPESRPRTTALTLFAVQLVLNAAWTPIFFGAEAPGWALVEQLLLDAAVIATAVAFTRIDRRAGALLVPYLAWLGFATLLNASIVSAN